MKKNYHFEFYRDRQGQHRSRIEAPNGNIIFDCCQGYSRKIDTRRALFNLLRAVGDGRVVERTK